MYVCHCNQIPEREIRASIDALTQQGSRTDATAADVLLRLNRHGKCLGCFPLIEAMLAGNDAKARLAPVPESSISIGETPSPQQRRRRGGAFARRNAS